MSIHDIRTLMRKGQPTVGSWLQVPSAHVAEILAKARYDWLAVDMEHGTFAPSLLPDIFRAIRCGGASPLVRVAEATKTPIKTALDAGAHGLIFPMIESRAQLDAAIEWALYPYFCADSVPHSAYKAYGTRGIGYACANGFGQDFTQYTRTLAQDILLVAQIEHITAVQNLVEIVAHPRLDALMIGPYDLAGSMGVPIHEAWEHEEFVATVQHICNICRIHAMPVGLHVVQPDVNVLAQRIAEGYGFIAYGTDAVFLWQGACRPSV